MHFVRRFKKKGAGFRISPADSREIERKVGSTGSLVINLLNLETREWTDKLSAIWTGGRIRVTDESMKIDSDIEYLVEVVKILPRKKGERI